MTMTKKNTQYPLPIADRKTLRTLSGSDLLQIAGKISKAEKTDSNKIQPGMIPLRIAVIGSCNTQLLTLALKPFLYAEGIQPIFYEGSYDSLRSEVLDPQSGLYSFQPDRVIAVVTARDVHEFPALLATVEEADALAEKTVREQISFWAAFHQHCDATVFLTNLVIPNRHILSDLEANLPSSRDRFLRKLNDLFSVKKPGWLHLLDFESIAADFGKDVWFDESAWLISKQPFAIQTLPTVAFSITKLLASSVGILRKCLVIDLDNTIWGGVIGDDGLDGINLDPNNALGEAFLDFQTTVKAYRDRGILLAVCSKNEREIASEPFRSHPNMKLKLDDIAVFKANWEDKPGNLRAIAAELNIGLDSLVFFDDNPVERGYVEQQLPEVEVIDVPEDPALYSRALLKADCFNWLQLSAEDLSRTESFQAQHQREEVLAAAPDYESYLRSLKMNAKVAAPLSGEMARFTQLINKTNQFNLRTQRYSESQIETLINDRDILLMRALLEDQFSNYGLISAMIIRLDRTNQTAFLDSWVMSCRVFKRELEAEMMNRLVETLLAEGILTLTGEYIPTPKNNLIRDLLPTLGFEPQETEGGENQFVLDLAAYQAKETPFYHEGSEE